MSAYSFLFVDTNFKFLDFSIQVDVTEEIRKEERDREDKKGERALGNIRRQNDSGATKIIRENGEFSWEGKRVKKSEERMGGQINNSEEMYPFTLPPFDKMP